MLGPKTKVGACQYSWAIGTPPPSKSGGIKMFFTTGIDPWRSYTPILWLNVISPNRKTGIKSCSMVKKPE
jgi:hypothetical protein